MDAVELNVNSVVKYTTERIVTVKKERQELHLCIYIWSWSGFVYRTNGLRADS